MQDIPGTFYMYDSRLNSELANLRERVDGFRTLVSTISGPALQNLTDYFRLKNIYHSNAIEGNLLSLGETQLVIQEGLTITGKPLKDSIEVKNLSSALDFFETLADREGLPVTTQDIRNIHACILKGIDDPNAGAYRSVFVEISGSKHRPPDPARIPVMMEDLGDWLTRVSDISNVSQNSIDPVVLACVAHAWLVHIHPFIDGNGRTARLLMNLLLIRRGYPLAIITKDERQRYYDALEESDEGGDLTPFLRLVLESVDDSIEVYEHAARTQLDLQQFVQSLVREKESLLRNEYEVFRAAMLLFKGYFAQVVQMYDDRIKETGSVDEDRIGFKDFGVLEYDKYHGLRISQSAKKTWFFRLTFFNNVLNKAPRRYLFFFGFSSSQISAAMGQNQVTLHTATETDPYYYERLGNMRGRTDIPDIVEIGYLPAKEEFVYLDSIGTIHHVRAEEIAQEFIRQGLRTFRLAGPL